MASSNDTSSSSQGNIETNRGAMPAFQAKTQFVDEFEFRYVKDHLFSNRLIDYRGETKRGYKSILAEPTSIWHSSGSWKFLKVHKKSGYNQLKLKIKKPLSKQNKDEISFDSSHQRGFAKPSPDELYHVEPCYLYPSDSRARATDKLFKADTWNESDSSLYPSDPKVTTTESDRPDEGSRTFRSGTGTGPRLPAYPRYPRVNFEGLETGRLEQFEERVREWGRKVRDWYKKCTEWSKTLQEWFSEIKVKDKEELKRVVEEWIRFVQNVIEGGAGGVNIFESEIDFYRNLLHLNFSDDVIYKLTSIARENNMTSSCKNRAEVKKQIKEDKNYIEKEQSDDSNRLSRLEHNLNQVFNNVNYNNVEEIGNIGLFGFQLRACYIINCDQILQDVENKWQSLGGVKQLFKSDL